MRPLWWMGLAGMVLAVGVWALAGWRWEGQDAACRITHVSYDPTRALFREFNREFAGEWRSAGGGEVTVLASHGGSGKQARAVIDGLRADVVSLALPIDVDAIARHSGLVPSDWRERLPFNASPFTSSVVFVVRQGNPKGIRDWEDLARPGVGVVMPNPKTSGGAKLNYLSAWVYGLRRFGGDEAATEAFVRAVYGNVVVLDTGARGASTTFAQRRMGDVLVTWENEALLLLREFAGRRGMELELVVPSVSVLAEPSVAVVEGVTGRRGTTEVAAAYLRRLYSPAGQRLAAKHFFRPRDPEAAGGFPLSPPAVLVRVEDAFGGWSAANTAHFGAGGTAERVLMGSGGGK